MSLSPVKQEILEAMLLQEKSVNAADLAKAINKEFQQVKMNLLGLTRMGYVSLPEKGQFLITEKGKAAIGIPQITKEKAVVILAYSPHDKAFNFYAEVDKPLSLHAHSLRDFANKVEKADIVSVEFHIKRGDFEAWIKSLGDEELAKKIALLKKKNVAGENLRKQLHIIVEKRYIELANLTGQPIPIE